MNRLTAILFALASLVYTGLYAQDMSRVIRTQEFNWYGLDFSRVKMIGSMGFTDPDAVVNRYIHAKWNNVLVAEFKKYDPGKRLGKTANIYMDVCNERNKMVTEEGLIIDKAYNLLPKDIQQIVNTYPKKPDGDMGLIYIVESFNKPDETGYIWVTFFDEKTGQVLVTERIPGEAGGLGLRNYWLGAVHNVMKNMKKLYKNWVKNFG